LSLEGQARRDRLLRRAFDLGCNLPDVYPKQLEAAARHARGRRDNVLISLSLNPRTELDMALRLFGYVDLWRFPVNDNPIPAELVGRWDSLRKAKEAGFVRAIGISTHNEPIVMQALKVLEGIDYIFIPYNFIHSGADFSRSLPLAANKGVGIIAMKPLAMGSIKYFDLRPRPGIKPDSMSLQEWVSRYNYSSGMPDNHGRLLVDVVAGLVKNLGRMPDETLCMAAMRYCYSRPYISTVICGMYEDSDLEDNYSAMARHQELLPEERASLDSAKQVAKLLGSGWLPTHYRWLEEQWGVS
jgi:aryl-alcohol dehydrogenase-like predicted oxidoreductase